MCIYDGQKCLSSDACNTYVALTSGSGALVYCSNLNDRSLNKCTFTSGPNCSARTCTDTVTSPNAANCKAYLSTCLFNGTSCIVPDADCANYTPTGVTDAAKAAICNSLTNSGGAKCTYITGSTGCINAAACDS